MWKSLLHPNVLPLMGVATTETRFTMVSEWMVHGNINDFVKTHPDVDRLRLVGFLFKVLPSRPVDDRITLQLEGVATGLIYIHNQGVIHGDLKGVRLL